MCDVKGSNYLIPGSLRNEHFPTIPDNQPVPISQLSYPKVVDGVVNEPELAILR